MIGRDVDVNATLCFCGITASRPANDDFENAQAITGVFGTVSGATNVDATTQLAESRQDPYVQRGYSVWYLWTAPAQLPLGFNLSFDAAGL